MSKYKEVISACLEARDKIESIFLQHHDITNKMVLSAKDVANQLVLQLLILMKIADLGLFSGPNSTRGPLKSTSQQLVNLSINNADDDTSHGQFFFWLVTTLTNFSNVSISELFDSPHLSDDPLVVMEPEAIQLLQSLSRKTFCTNQGKSSNVQYSNHVLEEVFSSLDKIRTKITNELIGELGEHLLVNDERKKKGIFYTPPPLTRYMAQKAIETWMLNKLRQEWGVHANNATLNDLLPQLSPDQLIFLANALLSMKVLDPAAGSGHFLVACLSQISFILEEIKKILQISQLDNQSLKLNISCCKINDEKEILIHVMFHVLHGVDVNPFAVKLTRTRLFLTLLEMSSIMASRHCHERSLLSNIKAGNALLGFVRPPHSERSPKNFISKRKKDELGRNHGDEHHWDLLYWKTLSAHLKNGHLHGEEKKCLFHWFIEFPDVFRSHENNVGFDLIICNPPYLSLKSSKTSKMWVKPTLLRRIFGKIQDLYECFIKRADELLNSSGVACFIVPNNVITHLPRDLESRLTALDNIGERVFPNAPTTPVAIMIWSKGTTSKQVAFKNLINARDKITKLSTTKATIIPHLQWSREHPVVRILKETGITLNTIGVKVTRGEEIGKKALIREKQAKLNHHIPIFAASDMRFYGLNAPTYHVNLARITKRFYDQPKLGFSISFRNRIKCSFLGTNVTLKSIICLYDLPRKWTWWLLLFYNSSIFDFYHRCIISWYQEKRTNTIAEIRNFPVFLLKKLNITGLQNLARLLAICYDSHLHHLLDLSLIEMILPDLISQVEEDDLVLTEWLNKMGKRILVPDDLIKFYPPHSANPQHQQLLKEVNDLLKRLKTNFHDSAIPKEVKEIIRILETTEKHVLQSYFRMTT